MSLKHHFRPICFSHPLWQPHYNENAEECLNHLYIGTDYFISLLLLK